MKFSTLPLFARIGIILLAVLFIFLLAYFLFLMPKYEEINQVRKQIADKDVEIDKANKAIQQLPIIRKELAMWESQADTFRKLIPDRENLPQLLENLAEAAIRADVNYVPFATKVGEAQKFTIEKRKISCTRLPIQIEWRTRYRVLAAFLDEIHKMDRLILVPAIKISRSADLPRLNAKIEAYAFSWSP